jgi:hypothetical protein
MDKYDNGSPLLPNGSDLQIISQISKTLKHNKNDFAQNSPQLIFARLSDHTINDCAASSIARESRSAES